MHRNDICIPGDGLSQAPGVRSDVSWPTCGAKARAQEGAIRVRRRSRRYRLVAVWCLLGLFLYHPVANAHQITVPTLFIDAGKDELMNLERNAVAVTKILKAKGVTVVHHIIPDMTHYGVYRQDQKKVTQMEIDWFDKYLKTAK